MAEAAPRRVLLDENVDRQLKPLFEAEFEVLIVPHQVERIIRMLRFCLLVASLLVAHSIPSAGARAQGQPAADSVIALPTEWSTYYVVLLKQGPAYAEELPADSLQALMNRHIQYQLRLQQSERALASGGFGQGSDGMAGMTLLRAESLDEAERLAQADPAVAAGRLTAVVYEWYVPAGRLLE